MRDDEMETRIEQKDQLYIDLYTKKTQVVQRQMQVSASNMRCVCVLWKLRRFGIHRLR